ncbi:PREDICTED: agamous-like MADS-box protein AGL80 isoform X2 [Camelina sativa]|uniref:Agamous-like MADS-box protein AGL80 isoform X2 n=1 Tax=Camelina sativa TaxID=90675 RepID=A0ABM1RMD9_CAMSA|nr:PREDICTED: agamous-like MADS-box protein AGL80 isoform X2 [Camelina sativa]
MTRKKVKLAFITNDSSRKATFKKRKKGLMKKVNELSTLCGISACAIIYSPYDSNPEVWPSNSGVQRIVSEFRTLPEMDQQKKMVDQETFLRQRIAKASDHLRRQRKDNRELEMTEVMFQCLLGNMGMFHMNIMDLNDLGFLIEQYLKDINRRFEILQSSGMEIGESSNAAGVVETPPMEIMASTTPPTTTTNDQAGSSSSPLAAFLNPLQQQQQQHQQFLYPSSPHVGLYEQPPSLNLNLNKNYSQNQQQWFMEMMHHQPEPLNYAVDDEQRGFLFMDDHHQPQDQHQQILGDSSTVSTIVTSSSTIPVTNPSPTNNTWFR